MCSIARLLDAPKDSARATQIVKNDVDMNAHINYNIEQLEILFANEVSQIQCLALRCVDFFDVS